MSRPKKLVGKPWKIAFGIVLLVLFVIVGTMFLLAGKNIAVLNPQGVVAAGQKDLIIFTLLLSAIVVIPVFVMLGVFSWKYREGNTAAKYTPDVDGNRWLETLWWGIPIVIIAILGVVTWISTHQLDPYKPLASNVQPINVQVVAIQWKWLFLYPDLGIASLNELRMPVGTPVNFTLTADGPMSSLWIPNLGTQTYAMTGMSSQLHLQADKAGSYRGSNSNINGTGYADMTFQAVAMPSRYDFDTWVNKIKNSTANQQINFAEYEKLAKPSRGSTVTYYRLGDSELYTEVMKKFMPEMSGTMTSNSSYTSHADAMESN